MPDPSPARGLRPGSVALGAAALALLAGCAGPSTASDRRAAVAAEHARTAGVVMTRGLGAVPVRDAAVQVTGTADVSAADGDTARLGASGVVTIQALRADGTTWDGSAVLSVEVSTDDATIGGGSYRGCFAYTFRHRIEDSTPRLLGSCPPVPALALTTPPPPPGVTDATVAAVRRALDALPVAQRSDATHVRQALRTALGPAYALAIGGGDGTSGGNSGGGASNGNSNGGAGGGAVTVQATSGDQCVLGTISPAGVVDIRPPAHGTDCRGG